MSTTASESDPFFQLLSEALRAGPGSAQWGEAVAKLRDGGIEGADEYRLIIRAREDLEQGRDFRKVSAGPQFTRKVLDAIEEEGQRRSTLPTTTIVAIISAVVIIGVIVTVIVMMSGGGSSDPQQVAIEQLDKATFSKTIATETFKGKMAVEWETIGSLPVDFSNGMTIKPGAAEVGTFAGAGVIFAKPLDAGSPVLVEAEVEASADSRCSVHVFVSDTSQFSNDRATSPREVVAILQSGRASADVNGQTLGESTLVPAAGKPTKLSIRVADDAVVITADGHRLYAGPHNLQAGAPRTVGVRLIRPAGDATPAPVVKSIEISQAVAK